MASLPPKEPQCIPSCVRLGAAASGLPPVLSSCPSLSSYLLILEVLTVNRRVPRTASFELRTALKRYRTPGRRRKILQSCCSNLPPNLPPSFADDRPANISRYPVKSRSHSNSPPTKPPSYPSSPLPPQNSGLT